MPQYTIGHEDRIADIVEKTSLIQILDERAIRILNDLFSVAPDETAYFAGIAEVVEVIRQQL